MPIHSGLPVAAAPGMLYGVVPARTLRAILSNRRTSAVKKTALLTMLAVLWAGSVGLLVFGFTRPVGEKGGWVIVGFWTLVVAVVATVPNWYRERPDG